MREQVDLRRNLGLLYVTYCTEIEDLYAQNTIVVVL